MPLIDTYSFFIEINVDTADDLLASLEKYIHKKRGILIQRLKNIHCVKRVRIQSFSDPYFLALGLNTEGYGENSHHKNCKYGHFLRSDNYKLRKNFVKKILKKYLMILTNVEKKRERQTYYERLVLNCWEPIRKLKLAMLRFSVTFYLLPANRQIWGRDGTWRYFFWLHFVMYQKLLWRSEAYLRPCHTSMTDRFCGIS